MASEIVLLADLLSGCSIGATAKWRDPSSGVGIQRTGAGGGLNASHLDRTSEQVEKG
jgi:hypothetical protein